MYTYIGIEDLAANALIELLERQEVRREQKIRQVSFKALMEYGSTIIRLLNASGKNAVLFITKDSTSEMVHDYADFFEIVDVESNEYIKLKDEKTAKDLRKQFRMNLTLDYLLAFTRTESLSALKV